MKFHTKLKTTSTGNNTFLFISHRNQKKILCNKYSDIRFRFRFRPDSLFDIRWYSVPAEFKKKLLSGTSLAYTATELDFC